MKTTLRVLLCLLALGAFSAQADITKCVGLESDGSSIHVLLDSDSNTINIDGEIYKIVAPTKGHNGISTEDYLTDKGHTVYDSIVYGDTKDKATFYQINDKTGETIAEIPVACHVEGANQ